MTVPIAGHEPIPFPLKVAAVSGIIYFGTLSWSRPDLLATPGPLVFDLVMQTPFLFLLSILIATPLTVGLMFINAWRKRADES